MVGSSYISKSTSQHHFDGWVALNCSHPLTQFGLFKRNQQGTEKYETNLPRDVNPLSHEVLAASEHKFRINVSNKKNVLQDQTYEVL